MIAPPVGEVRAGEEQLRRDVAVVGQAAGVLLHQEPLPHGGARLLGGHGHGPLLIAEEGISSGDCAAGHHYHLMPRVARMGDLRRERAQPRDVQLPALFP